MFTLYSRDASEDETIETLHVNRYRFGNGDDRHAAYTVDFILDKCRDRAA